MRDVILLAGGLFLLYKAVKEIHHTVELREEKARAAGTLKKGFPSVITQIVLLDIVFSIDSVITAVGLTNQVWVIIGAVILSFVVILFFAGPVGEFILHHPALKILALSFPDYHRGDDFHGRDAQTRSQGLHLSPHGLCPAGRTPPDAL